jgi:hypothetical protein
VCVCGCARHCLYRETKMVIEVNPLGRFIDGPSSTPTPVSWPWRSPPLSEACQRNISSGARASKEKLISVHLAILDLLYWRSGSGSVQCMCFRPPVSGSVCQMYGSGSFDHRAKIVRKTLIPTRYCFVTSLWLFIFEKWFKKFLQNVISRKSASAPLTNGSRYQNVTDPQHWLKGTVRNMSGIKSLEDTDTGFCGPFLPCLDSDAQIQPGSGPDRTL